MRGRHRTVAVEFNLTSEQVDAFWERVQKAGPDDCWEWLGARGTRGYGRLTIARGRAPLAHRIAFHLAHGAVPSHLCVMHKCDHPPCVNPAHLSLGTHRDNVHDRDRKGRQVAPGALEQLRVRVARLEGMVATLMAERAAK